MGRPGERSTSLVPVDSEAAQKSHELVASNSPRSVISEAYRAIRTGILLSTPGAPPQVILFTSGVSGEGKTVTAVNQAVTLVQAGGRVLLIDADIRKPRLHRIFRIPNGSGLSTYLAGQSRIVDSLHEVSLNGETRDDIAGKLFVLPSGPLPPNPAELLGSRRMRELLQSLRADFDYIVIDTPPVLPVTDAVVLASFSDGVVLVVRGQVTPVAVSRESRDRLLSVNAKLLGVVLNDVDLSSGDYEYYKSHYYAYYAEISRPSDEA
jgi:capsular exopolysaccharide synthesis family protein